MEVAVSVVRHLRAMTRYKSWANEQTFAAVLALPEDEALKRRDTLFGSIAHTLNHNLVIDQVWQAHLEGRPHGFEARNTPTHPPLAEMWEAQRRMDAWFVACSDGLTEAAALEPVGFAFIGGGDGRMSRADMVMHVVTHGCYHRGFVAEMMFQIPVRPPATDMPVFLRDAPPMLD